MTGDHDHGPRAQEGEQRQSRVPLRGRGHRECRRQLRLPRLRASGWHRLALRRRAARRRARLPVHRRGWTGLAGRRARDGDLGPQPRPRRRPAAARPGPPGLHPDGSEASVLEHLLGGERRSRRTAGIFLERTCRMHPDVCGFISEEFYEGRLRPDPVTSERTTPFGTGLRWLRVEHTGNRQDSPEEVEAVVGEIGRLTAAGVQRRRRSRSSRRTTRRSTGSAPPCPPPSRSARSTSSRASRRRSCSTRWRARAARTCRAASSSSSRATGSTSPSRGRSASRTSSCSPRLLEVDCRTIEQMRLANALCRFVELASEPSLR